MLYVSTIIYIINYDYLYKKTDVELGQTLDVVDKCLYICRYKSV